MNMLMGVEMNRPSRLSVDVDFDDGDTWRARLHGRANRVLTGSLNVPPEEQARPH